MSVKILAEILLYNKEKHLYSREEREQIKKELYKSLDVGVEKALDILLDIIDKINDD